MNAPLSPGQRFSVPLALTLALILVLVLMLPNELGTPLTVKEPSSVHPPPSEPYTEPDDAASPASKATRVAIPQVPSLAGTEVDGALSFDAHGRLIEDRKLRRLFDYHLAALGERDLDEIRNALYAQALALADPDRAAQVMAAFGRYLDYLDQVDRLVLWPGADLLQRFEALYQLRRQRLGESAADAFFAEEEAQALALLARLEGVAENDESGPWVPSTTPLDDAALALEQTHQFEQLDIDDDQRHIERSALFGEDAAARLAALDAERAQWQQRVAEFHATRDAILSDPALDALTREAAIQQLLDIEFDDAERRRVLSLLRIPP